MTLSSGIAARMNRLFNPDDGRAVCVAADHGWMSDPTPNVIELEKILKQVVAGGADGILISFGTALRMGHLFRGTDSPAMIIRADWMNMPRLGGSNVSNILPAIHFQKEATSLAKHALQIGASAITIYYFIGFSDEFEARNIEQSALFAKECRKIGLPLIIEPMAVGAAVTGVNIAEILIASARIAVEIGADALKIPYTNDIATFSRLVNESGVPVLVLGGAKSDDPCDALELVEEALRAGASGTVFGRNVTKAKDPEKMVRDLCALVHDKASLGDIFDTKRAANEKLFPKSKNCSGCQTCLMVCTQKHEGEFGIQKARLRIKVKPFDHKPPFYKIALCNLCMKCVEQCEESALSINDQGIIKLDRELCNNCLECGEICPSKVIWFDDENYPVICDLCGGRPECIRWCKYDAISIRKSPRVQEAKNAIG